MPLLWAPDRVDRVNHVQLTVGNGDWAYASAHRDAIERHWTLASAANPNFFNGVIHLIGAIDALPNEVRARLLKIDFKSYLYWRDEGFPKSAEVLDGFGSALIRSSEGHFILGRQLPGNVNAGLAYMPGGFIDARDVRGDGTVDVRASVARELREETGLGLPELSSEPGFLVTRAGAHVSFAVDYRSALTSEALAAKIRHHIAADPHPELGDVVIVRSAADTDGLAMPHFARVLLAHVLKA